MTLFELTVVNNWYIIMVRTRAAPGGVFPLASEATAGLAWPWMGCATLLFPDGVTQGWGSAECPRYGLGPGSHPSASARCGFCPCLLACGCPTFSPYSGRGFSVLERCGKGGWFLFSIP